MSSVSRALTRLADAGAVLRNELLLVSDGADWAISEQTRRIAANLPASLHAGVVISVPGWTRHRTLHFVHRYAALEGDRARLLAKGNRLIVTWTHGGAIPDTTPELRGLLERLRAVARYVDLVHVQSTLYVPVMADLGFPASRIRLAPLGVDLSRFTHASEAERRAARITLGLSPDALVIGSFQRDGDDEPKYVKGPDVFVEVADRLAHSLPELVVLLTGPARGWIRRALARRRVATVYLGVVPAERLVLCHRACDTYLITSREEGGPLALLEAMATGTPVVSTRVGMSVDVVTDGTNGTLVDVSDVDALTVRTLHNLTNPARARQIGSAGAASARHYGWPDIGRVYAENLYLGRNTTAN